MASLTSFSQNQIIDALFRGQPLGAPGTYYVALVTVNGDATAAGTEVVSGGYARSAITTSLAEWAGTQGAGTTAASSGTSGETSNNALIGFPAPTANWGTVVGVELWDAPTGGNRWAFGALPSSVVVNSGAPAPTFPASSLVFQIG